MVLGGLIQKMNWAQADEKRNVLLSNIAKLSRKDFIKKFASKKFLMERNPEDKWWAGTTKFGTEKEAGEYYDLIKEVQKETDNERKQMNEDKKKLSREKFIKKYDVYKYPNYKYKVKGHLYFDLLGRHKSTIIPKDKALRALQGKAKFFESSLETGNITGPGVRNYNSGSPNFQSLAEIRSAEKVLGDAWDEINKKVSRKEVSRKETSPEKKGNLADELKELKKLYKDGTLSKEEFTKAKKKLLK